MSFPMVYDVALPPSVPITIENLGKYVDFQNVYQKTRRATLEIFATDESVSDQATMYKVAQRVSNESRSIRSVTYASPNKHYIPVNLTPFKLENGLSRGGGGELVHPVADPSSYVTATVTRKGINSSKL